MDWRALLHNRWVLGGVGVAGAAGLYVLYRRRSGGGGSSSTGSQSSPAYSSGGVGTFDSTGTDVASWLGNYSGNLQNQLDEYKQSLVDALAALEHVPTGPSGTGSLPTPRPVVVKVPPGTSPRTVDLRRYLSSRLAAAPPPAKAPR